MSKFIFVCIHNPLYKEVAERFVVAKTYGVAVFKSSFMAYVDSRPSKFRDIVKAIKATKVEQQRVANLPVAPARGPIGRVADVFV